jgi:hypothetical protein
VLQAPDGDRLPSEALDLIRRGLQPHPEHLQGEPALQEAILGEVDGAEAPLADLLL